MQKKAKNISNITVAYAGAKIAIAGEFAYAILVMLYVIIRSSITIYNIMPSGQRSNILLLNGFSIAYTVSIFSLLMAMFSTIVGAIASVILKKSLIYFNPQFNYKKTVIVSSTAALAILITKYVLLYTFLKEWMTFSYVETFSFWFLFPAIIFFIAYNIGGLQLNRILQNNLVL